MRRIVILSVSVAVVTFSTGESFAIERADCATNIDQRQGKGGVPGFPYWPVESPSDRHDVTQDYGQYWKHDSSQDKLWQHHVAFDITPNFDNANAIAAAGGWVATLVENGESDHGLGNTVIIHVGSHLYTMYAHLASWGSEEGEVEAHDGKGCNWVEK
ncbi:MAG TPA: hypothetical protein VGK90_05775, partial [Rhizomicrobium sp.]